MQREAVPEDVSMTGYALASVKVAQLDVEMRHWQEALAEDLSRSRNESGAGAARPEVNR